MTGLDKILAEIRDEAAAEAENQLADARQRADALLADAKRGAEEKTAKILADADADVADIERSRDSAATLQRRQRTLATKQELLAETLNAALQRLHALPPDEYFALLVKLAAGAAQPGAGEMLLNEADKKRLPKGFEKEVAAALPQGRTITLSGETRPIDGGFVLKYGDVEENCSFADMLAARADEFSDLVREVLFA